MPHPSASLQGFSRNPEMQPAKHAKQTKAEVLERIARLILRVNLVLVGTHSFRVLSRVWRVIQFCFQSGLNNFAAAFVAALVRTREIGKLSPQPRSESAGNRHASLSAVAASRTLTRCGYVFLKMLQVQSIDPKTRSQASSDDLSEDCSGVVSGRQRVMTVPRSGSFEAVAQPPRLQSVT